MGERTDWDAGGVRALRRALGLTQAELAGELGVRQQTVSEWETGAYRPRGASGRLLTIIADRASYAPREEPALPVERDEWPSGHEPADGAAPAADDRGERARE